MGEHRSRSGLLLAAIILAAVALMVVVAVGAGDDDQTPAEADPRIETRIVRDEEGHICVEATLASAERTLTHCPAKAGTTQARLSVDCPTRRVIAFGSVASSVKAVKVETGAGAHIAATLTEPSPDGDFRGFAAPLRVSDFPASLRTDGRRADLPDPVAFCAANPDLTILLGGGRE